MNNLSEVTMLVAAGGAGATLYPKALTDRPNKELPDSEAGAATAALTAPKAGSEVVLDKFTAEELPNPENPEAPKPPAVSGFLNEKEAADEAGWLPKPMEGADLAEDVTPNAEGSGTIEELPNAVVLPEDGPTSSVFDLKEELLALLLLLLLSGKPDDPKVDVCCPPNPKAGNG